MQDALFKCLPPNDSPLKKSNISVSVNQVLDSDKLKTIKLSLDEALIELNETLNNSAEKDFCEHNIKKALKWLDRIK